MTAVVLQTIFAGLLVIITAVYAWTTKRQLTAMEKALEETRRSNEATEESNAIAKRGLELGKRAWLIVSIKTVLDRGNFNGYNIELTNVGGIPATDIEARYRFDLWEGAEVPDSIPPSTERKPEIGLVIGAGMTHVITPPASEFTYQAAMKLAGKHPHTFYCEVSYFDFFRKPRKTVACWQYAEKWVMAPKHNRLE